MFPGTLKESSNIDRIQERSNLYDRSDKQVALWLVSVGVFFFFGRAGIKKSAHVIYLLNLRTFFYEMAGTDIEQLNGKLTRNGLQVLMRLYADDLFLFVRGIIHNSETAEELVSDVFVKIWDKRDHFSAIQNVKSYLFITARNISISFIIDFHGK